MVLNANLSAALAEFKEKERLSNEAMAKLAGVSARTVQRWINGKAKSISPSVIERLLPHLNAYLDATTFGGESPFARHVAANWELLSESQKLTVLRWILEAQEKRNGSTG